MRTSRVRPSGPINRAAAMWISAEGWATDVDIKKAFDSKTPLYSTLMLADAAPSRGGLCIAEIIESEPKETV
ncbi:hypothetical protein D3C84_1168980 [compost metagenome]